MRWLGTPKMRSFRGWITTSLMQSIGMPQEMTGYYDQRKDAAVNWIEVRLQKLIDTNIASWAEYRLAHPAH